MAEHERSATEAGRTALEAWRQEAAANAFDSDPFLQALLRRYAGGGFDALAGKLRGVATEAGQALSDLVSLCNEDENLPRLRRYDPFGRPLEDVVFHPAHHQVGRVFWSSGVLSGLAEPGNELSCGAIVYLLDQQGEAGHACPVACTAGAIKLLQTVGTEDQKRWYLPGLLEEDYDRRLHAAQFVTEVQGGSDVGANECRAVADPDRPGRYRLTGEKWFCSVADASLFVVSARVEGAPSGTRGLGLFLVPRTINGVPNGFRLRRLKPKLGTRSLPTAEMELEGAVGELVGEVTEGFRNLVSIVLDTSRVHNALAAAGLMRRAFVEALSFARHREAFGGPILGFPPTRTHLARMKIKAMTALATTLRILRMSDRLATGDGSEELEAARRIDVMINKYWTSVACTETVRDAIEVLGGNGTIEDFSVLPRLYRDAIVVESWEGTHNTLCAQVLRDFRARKLHDKWLAAVESEIHALGESEGADQARALFKDVSTRQERLLEADDETASASIRQVVNAMCRLVDWVALSAQRHWESTQQLDTIGNSLEIYRKLRLESEDLQDQGELATSIRDFATSV